MVIREMCPDDAAVVYRMAKDAPEFHAAGLSELCFWSEEVLIDWSGNPGNDVLLVAEEDGLIAGFVFARFHQRTGKADWENEFVLESHRGRGIARALYAEMEDRLRSKGARFISFLVKESNSNLMIYRERFGMSDSVKWFLKEL